MPTPYVSQGYLTSYPTGLNWNQVSGIKSPTAGQITAILGNIAWTASRQVDNIAEQTIRASVYTEQLPAPGARCAVPSSGVAQFLTSFFPVTAVLAANVSYGAGPPYQYQPIPLVNLSPLESDYSPYGTTAPGMATGGMNQVLVGGGYVSWSNGRHGQTVQITYMAGWPHSGLTEAYLAGVSSIHVDDVTGMNGAQLTIPDVTNGREFVTVSSVTADTTGTLTPQGPGTLTLSAPTLYPHPAGELVTGIPDPIMEATVWLCVSAALSRSAQAVTAPPQQGRQISSGAKSMDEYIMRAEELISPYRRRI